MVFHSLEELGPKVFLSQRCVVKVSLQVVKTGVLVAVLWKATVTWNGDTLSELNKLIQPKVFGTLLNCLVKSIHKINKIMKPVTHVEEYLVRCFAWLVHSTLCNKNCMCTTDLCKMWIHGCETTAESHFSLLADNTPRTQEVVFYSWCVMMLWYSRNTCLSVAWH